MPHLIKDLAIRTRDAIQHLPPQERHIATLGFWIGAEAALRLQHLTTDADWVARVYSFCIMPRGYDEIEHLCNMQIDPKPEPVYNHAFDFGFEVLSPHAEPTAAEIRAALIERANRLSDDELLEAAGCFDTMEIPQ